MKFVKQFMVWVLCSALLITTSASAAGTPASTSQGQAAQDANLTPRELDNLVAPIALYPDALMAQILAAATYPDQITAANDWLKANSNLKDQALMEAADKQDWDPGVKALTQFPSVLDNMAKNLSWTSALGEASYYQQKDVMAAIQRLRKEAKSAGNLKSGEQIKVVQQDPQTIIIQPANPTGRLRAGVQPNRGVRRALLPSGIQQRRSGGHRHHLVWRWLGGRSRHQRQPLLRMGLGLWRMGYELARWHGNLSAQRVRLAQRGVSRRISGRVLRWPANPTPYNRGNVNTGNINRGNVNSGNVNSGNRNTNIARPTSVTPSTSTPAGTPTLTGQARAHVLGRAPAAPAVAMHGGTAAGRAGRPIGPVPPASAADRGYGQRTASTNSGAFSGYNKGGNARADSNRGSSSVSGGSGGAARTPQARPSGGGKGGRR